MRIISGKYKGKKIIGEDIIGTRPTMDRVKESLFATIQDYIKGTCLDLFAGSGSLGLEAISNGCDMAYFVDNNPKAIEIINKNITSLKTGEEYFTLLMDYEKAINYFKENSIKFDLVFLDPPYKDKILNNVLKLIYEIVNQNGVVVLEYENDKIEKFSYQELKTKKYGNKYITIMKK